MEKLKYKLVEVVNSEFGEMDNTLSDEETLAFFKLIYNEGEESGFSQVGGGFDEFKNENLIQKNDSTSEETGLIGKVISARKRIGKQKMNTYRIFFEKGGYKDVNDVSMAGCLLGIGSIYGVSICVLMVNGVDNLLIKNQL